MRILAGFILIAALAVHFSDCVDVKVNKVKEGRSKNGKKTLTLDVDLEIEVGLKRGSGESSSSSSSSSEDDDSDETNPEPEDSDETTVASDDSDETTPEPEDSDETTAEATTEEVTTEEVTTEKVTTEESTTEEVTTEEVTTEEVTTEEVTTEEVTTAEPTTTPAPLVDGPWIMAVGGNGAAGESRAVDVLGPNGGKRVPGCIKENPGAGRRGYPFDVEAAVGLTINRHYGEDRHGAHDEENVPLVCGGKDNYGDLSYVDRCWTFDGERWKQAGRMSTARYGAAASYHDRLGMVITGGESNDDYLDTVESTVDGVNFKANYPRMLSDVNVGHCQVTVGSDLIYVFGGKRAQKRADGMSISNEEWFPVDDIPVGFRWHSCGATRGSNGAHNKVVLAGGIDDSGDPQTAVYVFDIRTWGWTAGSVALPMPIARAGTAQLFNTFAVVGGSSARRNGFSDKVYYYDAASGGWREQRQRMAEARDMLVAFSVLGTGFEPC